MIEEVNETGEVTSNSNDLIGSDEGDSRFGGDITEDTNGEDTGGSVDAGDGTVGENGDDIRNDEPEAQSPRPTRVCGAGMLAPVLLIFIGLQVMGYRFGRSHRNR